MTKAPRRSPKVPRIDPRAYHGPLGEIVRQLAPTTEADPVGVLASLLAYVGTMIGDGPHVRVGNRPPPARIWPLLLGATGSGRKGTATADAESVVTAFDSYFLQECQVSGLSTGEGLIHRLRDRDGDDAGATDKRLLVIESEFARVLGITRREGNTLSEVLRGMWESGAAAVLTRGQPLACTGAHVSIIGHVTQRELRIKLAERDVAGGLVNRFLPLVVDRSQLLPYEVDSPDLRAVTAQVQRRIAAARKVGRVRRTPAAEDLWGDAYLALNDDRHDGPLGEVIARGAPYTLRIALLYALLDGRQEIDTDHLLAALALWQYAVASARQTFGDFTGRTDLDRLRDFLASASGGRTRMEVADLFGRNKDAREIDALIAEFEARGDVTTETERTGRPGRPTIRHHRTGAPVDALTELLEQHEKTRQRAIPGSPHDHDHP